MYRIIITIGVLLPSFAFALVSGISDLIDMLIDYVSAIIPIFLSLAILTFFWGIIKFIAHTDDEKAREEGKRVMVWGMVAIFVMVSLWAIVGFIQESLGIGTYGLLGATPALPTALPAS